MPWIALVPLALKIVQSGIELTRSLNNAFNKTDTSGLNLGQAAGAFTADVNNFAQHWGGTEAEKRRREQEQQQLDYTNRFNLQEQQYTIPDFNFDQPQETTFPT